MRSTTPDLCDWWDMATPDMRATSLLEAMDMFTSELALTLTDAWPSEDTRLAYDSEHSVNVF